MAAPNKTPIAAIYPDDGGEPLLVDMDTGEVLEGRVPKMDRLLQLAFQAEAAEKAWGTAEATYKAIIRRELAQADIKKVSGGPGDAVRIAGANQYLGNGDALMQWMEDVEFPPDAIRPLLACAVSFNVDAFLLLCASLGIEESVARKVVRVTPWEYVRLYGAKPAPPRIERRAREE